MSIELTILYEEGNRECVRPYVQLRKYSWPGTTDYVLEYGSGATVAWGTGPSSYRHEISPGIHGRKIPEGKSDSECIREAIAKYDKLDKKYKEEMG